MARIVWLLAVVWVVAMVAEAEARACGGTFCDRRPVTPSGGTMQVDQTGENVLFVMDEGTVEAHVQIQYDGNPEAFAWVVPVMARPEIEAGSEALFRELLAATVPTFVVDTIVEDCGLDAAADGAGDMSCGAGSGDEETPRPEYDDTSKNDGTPEVLDRGTAGAFEYAVLDGGTIDGVTGWLDDNDYAQDEDAPPILEEYLEAGFLFVAFKLRPGTETSELHPIVIRHEGVEPCIPLRLTRIAAADDMGVRVFFLGEHRVAPTNYRSVRANRLLIDWLNLGSNYESVVTRAVDADGSDGHGFVTEYAGGSDVVGANAILGPNWVGAAFVDVELGAVASVLELQGLLTCDDSECAFGHPLLEAILADHLPRPSEVSAPEFFGCLECYVNEASFDGAAFASDIEERIIAPAEHAIDLLEEHPYLTRLFTTISPHEMTRDPLFHANPDLPDVSNIWEATIHSGCDGWLWVLLPDGRSIVLDPGGRLPERMPPAASVAEVGPLGAPMMLADNGAAIQSALRSWNYDVQNPRRGCGCRAKSPTGTGWVWLGLLVFVGARARRKRRTT